MFVPTGSFAFEPGSATSTGEHIRIEGAPTFDSAGQIDYLTVTRQEANVGIWLWSHVDDTIEIVSRERAIPSGDADKDRKINEREMNDSKTVASVVALEKLGFTVTRSGSGAFIRKVGSDTPAERAGLQQGDVIVSVDNQPIALAGELQEALGRAAVGATVSLGVKDSSAAVRTVPAVLAENPDRPGRPYLGVALETADEKVKLPIEVDIDSGQVGGPSAGLAWTLGVIDKLTPGDLTGGRKVAVTGTMDETGQVGPIGGLLQKSAAALDEGATVLLYPKSTPDGEVRRVREFVDGRLRLEPVGSVDDALAILAPGGVPKVGAGR